MQHLERLAIIAVVNLIIYYRTLFYGYVGDDIERSARQEPAFKNAWHRRWIQFIGLRHINSMVSHLLTLTTHTTCCVMIYLALGMNNLSFLTALLFSINPINLQGSVWISGRNYVTSSILTLTMFLFPYFSFIPYWATSYFAVNAWFAPLLFLGTPYWYMVGIIPLIWLVTKHNRNTLHRKLWETGGLKTTNTEMRAIKWQKIIPFTKTFLYYFTLAIFPYRLGIDHDFLRGFGTNKHDNAKGYKIDQYFAMGFGLLVTLGVLFIRSILYGWSPLTWGLFWFSVNIAMWCNFVTYQQQIAERYIYLANIGMSYALASIILPHPILITTFLTAYLVRLIYAMEMYLSDCWAIEYNLIEMKKMHYMWLMRGVKKFMMKDHVGAVLDFQEAYIHKPYDLKILYNLATTYFVLGNPQKAREFLEKARNNIYDESEEIVKPTFDSLEKMITQVEEAAKRGEKQVLIDMSKLMVVR